jgi:hypothetical protein
MASPPLGGNRKLQRLQRLQRWLAVSQTVSTSVDAQIATIQGQSVGASASLSINASVSTAHGQSALATAALSLSSTASTSQGQSVTGTASGAASVDATIATSQAQSASGTAQNSLGASIATGQGQSSQATTARQLDGTITSAQAQTVTGFAGIPSTVDATIGTGQAQGINALVDGVLIDAVEQVSYASKREKKYRPLGGHYWKPEELARIEPLVTKQPISKLPVKEPEPITPKPRINRLDSVVNAHSALSDIGIHYKQAPVDYSQVIAALQIEIQQQKDDDDYAIATLMAMLL